MKNELNLVLKLIEQQHPNFGLYKNEKKVRSSFKEEEEKLFTPLLPEEFYRRLLRQVTQIQDGHTCLQMPPKLKRAVMRKTYAFPLLINLEEDLAVLAERYDTLEVGTKITKIDGVPVREVIEEISKYNCQDGTSLNSTLYAILLRLNCPKFYRIR
jgi:hypothetical protein